MLAKMIDKIVSLKQTQTFEVGGQTYTDGHLTRIPPHVDRPECITVSGLDGICKLIRTEMEKVGVTILVQAKSYKTVEVMTTYLPNFSRNALYRAEADVPGLRTGFRDRETALIELRSLFIPNEGTQYLLDLLSRITDEKSVSSRATALPRSWKRGRAWPSTRWWRSSLASCCGPSAPFWRWSSPRVSSCCGWTPTRASASSRPMAGSGGWRPSATSPTTLAGTSPT